jgi:glutamyl-tRNA reductase
MREVDVIIAATSSAEKLLSCDDIEKVMKARRNRPLLLIDLSVPRNIDPAVTRLDRVSLHNIDDLEALARRGVQARQRELTACPQIIEAHVAALIEKVGAENKGQYVAGGGKRPLRHDIALSDLLLPAA